MINGFINILIYIVTAWLMFNILYLARRDYFERKGVKLYYGIVLVYKKPYSFHSFQSNNTIRKLSYIAVIAAVYGVYVFYATMIAALLSKLGLMVLPAKPRVLIPGINITGIDLLYFALAILIAALVHELAHALVAASNSIEVKGLGFAILFFLPIAFTEINEEMFVQSSRKSKILTLSAGPASNIILALVMMFLLSLIISSSGLVIIGVEENSLAARYGIKENTIILEVNGKPATLEELSKVLHVNKTTYFSLKLLYPNGTIKTLNIVKPENTTKLGVLLTFMPNTFLLSIFGIQGALALVSIIRWIYIVNMSLGIINIAPIFVTDGARIVQELFGNTTVTNVVSTITLLLLLVLFLP